jgi:hypothetical protein
LAPKSRPRKLRSDPRPKLTLFGIPKFSIVVVATTTTMAAVNALRLMYVRMGFSNQMAAYITNEQGINSLEELENLDDKAVERLCQALKKPGGTIPNPNAGAQGAPALIPNPGFNVSIKAEENLKLAAYYIRHQKRINRPAMVAGITIDSVRRLRELRASEESHKDPTEKPVINDKNWPRTLEDIVEHLRNHLGQTHIPLAYVVRKEEEVQPHIQDPLANYPIIQDEMIGRAPHKDIDGDRTLLFNTDNKKVWTIIHELVRNHKCYTYIKGFARARDGRAAFLALRDHYLGINNVNRLASGAEHMLHTARYQNESKRFNFESYVSIHKEQHQILEQLEEDHGYKGMDEGTKVRHLLNGIKTDKLNVIKGQILGDPTLQTDFDRCVNLFKAYLEQVATDRSQTFNVSRVAIHDDGDNKNPKGKRDKNGKWVKNPRNRGVARTGGTKRKANEMDNADEVKDRYYTAQEYAALSHEQRSKLQKLREGRTNRQAAATLTELKAEIAELKANRDGTKSDSPNDGKPNTNRNNTALQRPNPQRN